MYSIQGYILRTLFDITQQGKYGNMEVLVKGTSKSYISRNLINGFLAASSLHVQVEQFQIESRRNPHRHSHLNINLCELRNRIISPGFWQLYVKEKTLGSTHFCDSDA